MPYLQYSPTAINGLYYTQIDDELRVGLPMELIREFDSQFRATVPKDRRAIVMRWYKYLSKEERSKVVVDGLQKRQQDEFYPDVDY